VKPEVREHWKLFAAIHGVPIVIGAGLFWLTDFPPMSWLGAAFFTAGIVALFVNYITT